MQPFGPPRPNREAIAKSRATVPIGLERPTGNARASMLEATKRTSRRRRRKRTILHGASDAAATPNATGTKTARDRRSTDPETGVASGMPEAAICVQDIDVQCVLQFTLIHAAGCALHRHTSRVIHRLELSNLVIVPRWNASSGERQRPGAAVRRARTLVVPSLQPTRWWWETTETGADVRVGDRRESGRFIKPGNDELYPVGTEIGTRGRCVRPLDASRASSGRRTVARRISEPRRRHPRTSKWDPSAERRRPSAGRAVAAATRRRAEVSPPAAPASPFAMQQQCSSA